jgi:phage gpG-like protein
MILSVSLIGERRLLDNLDRMPMSVRVALVSKMETLAEKLEGLVLDKLSGQVLSIRTGRLYDSIGKSVTVTPSGFVEASVFSQGVPYARIHEKGGITSAHVIYPKNAAVLRYIRGGREHFATRVNHPGSRIPARPYLSSSYREMSSQISKGIKDAVVQGIRQSMRQQ